MSADGTTTPVLLAEGITKSFGHVEALRGADLEVRPGEIHALLGDNGAGKSTLVKILSGVMPADSGTIEVTGEPVAFGSPKDAHDAGIETVYQDLALANTLPPGENIFLGREVTANGFLGRLGFVDRPAMRQRAQVELEKLGASLPSAATPVSSLSGGQRQAVAISRALIWGRKLLILDEPTAALGPKQTDFVLRLIKRVRDEQQLAILLISHNLPDVFEVADRVTVLRLGERVYTCPIGEATTESLFEAITGAAYAHDRTR